MGQQQGYSNMQALVALVRASLQSTLKSPSAVVFAIAFPLVFILVFGFLGGGSVFTINLMPSPNADTANELYHSLKQNKSLSWVIPTQEYDSHKVLSSGNVAAIIDIQEQSQGQSPRYKVFIQASTAQADKIAQLKTIINSTVQNYDEVITHRTAALISTEVTMSEVRTFTTIDFILPGQLGFSLLAGSVFGTAFIFFSLRETLVLKRFYATPVRREVIVLSEGIARMIFQLLGAVVIILVGYFAFDYTLINGWVTFFEMILVCALAIMVFMGFGFIISGVAKNQATIPPISNLVTLPQFLLAGTFFSIDVFPSWLQPFCKLLPLTYLNHALRQIAFSNASLWDIRIDILVLLIWGVVLYGVAAKVFKWE